MSKIKPNVKHIVFAAAVYEKNICIVAIGVANSILDDEFDGFMINRKNNC